MMANAGLILTNVDSFGVLQGIILTIFATKRTRMDLDWLTVVMIWLRKNTQRATKSTCKERYLNFST